MTIFKECLSCGNKWSVRNDYLEDPNVEIVGYQVDSDNLSAGRFLFNHSCGATMRLSVRHFNELYEGPIFKERATGSDECPQG